ncbi:HD domain-containing phosphohydrolase [Roseateles albus]|uniref:LuxR C-terminal-related transcriptional regulator n=1 Tax=Roseateles albus TaxID=2987525 RepID=A0ABT5KGH9_9BURK|nr:HD domain-containing phosphohydrolase [Roseateles albus]MDC8773030.1 LuxR C-terminal-related transcriptional regulator [Roseateles albus]
MHCQVPTISSDIDVHDAVKALAFVGDLSMGQPVDHSVRTAWLAVQLATELGCDVDVQGDSAYVALLRWSGCTANAPEFSSLMGDDVKGRQSMLDTGFQSFPVNARHAMGALATIHCEVSGEVARCLGMPSNVETSLRDIFESFDGLGKPAGLPAEQIPLSVFIVAAASDLEIFGRVYGLNTALDLITARADVLYPLHIVKAVQKFAPRWQQGLDDGAALAEASPWSLRGSRCAPLELIADVIDLKLPWLTGFSRRVANTAAACCQRMGGTTQAQQTVYRAGLIHGLGRASAPNAVFETTRPLSEGAQESLRLVPYWTARAGQRITKLRVEAELASYVDERLDGSGYFRGVCGNAISIEAQILGAAARLTLLQTAKPGRPALDAAQAARDMRLEAKQGRFNADIVDCLLIDDAPAVAITQSRESASDAPKLTSREIEVLYCISHGQSNKEAAQHLCISPSTVRAHLENVFRKLACSTRAAATVKAMRLGLLEASRF